jgi:ABC-2 type transport system ATP-binding protein
VLRAIELRKRYGEIAAVDGVSFEVAKGTCYGLLGPNGAGKTTAISLLVGLVNPDGGTATVGGHRSGSIEAKRLVGVAPQEIALYEELGAGENLRFFGALYGLSGSELDAAVAEMLALVQLEDRTRGKVSTFSGGMKRRLNIAAAMLHRPQALILDEPTVGVDPQSRNAIFEVLKDLQARGMTLLYTTHYMEEAARLCDRIGIMDHGKIMAEDTPAGLLRLLPASNRLIVDFLDGGATTAAEQPVPPWVKSMHAQGSELVFDLEDVTSGGPKTLEWLSEGGRRFTGFRSEQATLEDVFLQLTGRSLRDDK